MKLFLVRMAHSQFFAVNYILPPCQITLKPALTLGDLHDTNENEGLGSGWFQLYVYVKVLKKM